jgi:type II secretory pathway predicted ATPase ExeA
LTLFLFGQPELKQKVEDIKQLDQRIAIKCHLEAFGEEDTQNYINHRLRTAGRTEAAFDENALKMIYGRSGGIPRRINRICDFSLLVGMHRNAAIINKDIVEESSQSVERIF